MLAALDSNQAQQPDDVKQCWPNCPPEQRAEMKSTAPTAKRNWPPCRRKSGRVWRRRRGWARQVQQARSAAEQQLWPLPSLTRRTPSPWPANSSNKSLAAEQRDAQIELSVLLYNLAGYYGSANHHADAVACLAKVVAIDALTGHEDLADDRRALEAARQRAAAAETHTAAPPDIAALLASVPAAQRAQVEEALAQFSDELAQMGPEERDQLLQGIA